MDFDDARNATEEMFGQASLDDVREQEVTPEGNDGGEAPPDDTSEALPTEQEQPQELPVATQPMPQEPQPDPIQMELQQLRAQNDAIMQQNAQLQNIVNEMSQQNKQNIVEDAVEDMPILDIGGLSFADEDTLRRAQTDYAEKMAQYAKDSIMKELQPFIDEAKQGRAQKEQRAVIASLKELPELVDIEEMLPMMEQIISRNPMLTSENVPLDERMIAAYAMARGINAMNTPAPKAPTVEEMMDMYNSNPDFQNAVEQQRMAAIKNSQQVPPFSASSGAVNAALTIKDKPKTLDEAAERTLKMFGN